MRKTNMNQRELLLCQDAIRFLLLNGADRDKISKRGKIPFELCQNHPAKE